MSEAVSALGQVFTATGEAAIGWIPADWTDPIITIKGLIALLSVLLLLWHMNLAWCCIHTLAQKLRYLTLLAYAVLVAGGSLEQLHEAGLVLSYRHLGSVLVTSLLVITAIISLREAHTRGHDHPHSGRR